jgi:putative acetyltransferase
MIFRAESAGHIEAVRALFTEYAEWLGPVLCFPTVVQERASLPGEYAPPRGVLLLAVEDGQPAGCVALRPLAEPPHTAEVKRLYVRPAFRGRRLGRRLMEKLLAEAAALGYRRLRLDTVEAVMPEAVALYHSMGFREIGRYAQHVEKSVCMELELPSQG